uniref:Slc26a-1 n=1 Tax=Schmidtea mediterranea TaxID=79327 RepID=A0A0H3YF67_SCHMD|nr:slc26a-1 [Schmidtea mediterranea]
MSFRLIEFFLMDNRDDKLSEITNRKFAQFSIGNDDENSDDERETNNRKGNSLDESAVKALERAVSHIFDRSLNQPLLGVKGDKYFEPPTPFKNELGMVNIHRPIYSQSRFTKVFGENVTERKKHRFFDSVFLPISEKRNCREIIYSIFPILLVIKAYNFKKDFPLDFLSGITTGIMRIPQSMAYALLANLTPIFGLYTAFFSAMLYPVFGGSHHMAAGAQGVVSLLIGGGTTKIIKEMASGTECNLTITKHAQETNGSIIYCDAIIAQRKIEIAITITFMVGLIQCILGICRFGFLTNYLSDPLIGGYTTAAACSVVLSQLPVMMGFKIHSDSGIFSMYNLLKEFLLSLPKTNFATLIISVICMLVLGICKFLSAKFISKMKIPIPGELIVMIGAIVFSYFTSANSIWSVNIVGEIVPGFMKPRLPEPKYMLSTIETSFSAAIVSFAIGYSISKRMALKHDYDINGNQEIFAFGFMNCIGSFFNIFAATASMSASALHESLGGVSQIANLIAGSLMLLALLFMGPLFESTPECVLSTIILINLKSILFQFCDLRLLWKVSKIDFLLWLVTFMAVIILDVDLGLGIGVMFSLITIVFRTQWPYVCLLGRIPCTDIYKNINLTPDAEEIPGIKIFRFEGSLYFASAEHFRNSIQVETGLNATKIINSKKEREKKLIKVKELLDHETHRNSESTQRLIETNIIDMNIKEVHHIIVDFSTCSFIDSVGVRTIMQVINDYNAANISVFLSNVRAAVLAMLNNSCVLYSTVNSKHIFLSVHDAVLGALEDAQYMSERNFLIKDAAIKSATRCVSRIASDPEISHSMKFYITDRLTERTH